MHTCALAYIAYNYRMSTKNTAGFGSIESFISAEMDIPVHAFSNESRIAEFVRARHYLWYLIMRVRNPTLVAIARRYSRDHSTVLHAINKIESNERLKGQCELLLERYLAVSVDCEETGDNMGISVDKYVKPVTRLDYIHSLSTGC